MMNDTKDVYFIKCLFCVHRPSRAYGKVIEIAFFYISKNKSMKVVDCKLYGTVHQQYIWNVKGQLGEIMEKNMNQFEKIIHKYI
jgi:hypothetical protein